MSKRKLINQKEKYRTIEFKTEEPINIKEKTNFRFVMSDKFEVKAIDENLNEYSLAPNELTEHYKKDNGNNKILSKSIINVNSKETDIDSNLLSYDYIVAIDTSYDIINNIKIAFTAIATVEKTPISDTLKETINILEWDATGIDKPENLMYANTIKNLEEHILKHNLHVKIAVIVDSDLDNIPSFNERKLPIFYDYMLPNNFCIFYASSDGGNCLQNKFLKHCDKEAKHALYEFKNKD